MASASLNPSDVVHYEAVPITWEMAVELTMAQKNCSEEQAIEYLNRSDALSEEEAPAALKISEIVHKVLTTKESFIKEAQENRVGKEWKMEAIWIGGDLFNFASLSLAVAKTALAGHRFFLPDLFFGQVGGAMIIAVGIASLRVAVEASCLTPDGKKRRDSLLAIRSYFDAFCYCSIGVVMILISAGVKSSYFASHPFVLPLLFFVASIPMSAELCLRIGNHCANRDAGSKIQGKSIEELRELFNGFGSTFKEISSKFEEYQAEMGVEAAIEVFRLMDNLLQKKTSPEDLEAQKKYAEEKIGEWNRSLYLRFFQQLVYAAAFGSSVCAFAPKTADIASNAFMAAGNGVATYLDVLEPFKRNGPVNVAAVVEEEPQGTPLLSAQH